VDLNVVKMGDGWHWLSVMSVMGFDVNGGEPLSSFVIFLSYYIAVT
jgi:hypothetical protein